MREVEGRRVGVRWKPPALIYVYKVGQVLRMARIPVRDLKDEDIVDQIYKRHGLDLLQGLDKSHIERMITILRHHHGIEFEHEKKSDKTPFKSGNSAAESEIKSNSLKKLNDFKPAKIDLDRNSLRNNPLILSNGVKNNQKTKGNDILKLLNQASQSAEENEITVIDKSNSTDVSNQSKSKGKLSKSTDEQSNETNKLSSRANDQKTSLISNNKQSKTTNDSKQSSPYSEKHMESTSGSKSCSKNNDIESKTIDDLKQNQTSNDSKQSLFSTNKQSKTTVDEKQNAERNSTLNTENEKSNEIVTLINQDLNKVVKEKQELKNLLDKRPETNLRKLLLDDLVEDKVESEVRMDDAEDTDLDLDDIDIPLDPEEPKKPEIDLLDDDDFWS